MFAKSAPERRLRLSLSLSLSRGKVVDAGVKDFKGIPQNALQCLPSLFLFRHSGSPTKRIGCGHVS